MEFLLRFLKSALVVVAVALFIWFYAVPWLRAHQDITDQFEHELRVTAQDFTENSIEETHRQNASIYRSSERGVIDRTDRRIAFGRLAQNGNDLRQDLEEAIDHLHGRTRGGVSMPVTTDVDDEQPLSWYDTGKRICGPTRIEVWGTATHEPEGYALHKWVGPLGWQEATPEEEANFRRYSKVYHMLEPSQPFMAALGRLGLSGQPFIFDEMGSDGHFAKTVRPGECQTLYTAVNGFTRLYNWETGRIGIHLTDLARQRQGGFEINVIPLQ